MVTRVAVVLKYTCFSRCFARVRQLLFLQGDGYDFHECNEIRQAIFLCFADRAISTFILVINQLDAQSFVLQ